MGTVFLFYFLALLLLLTVVLLLVRIVAKKKDYGRAIFLLWGGIFILCFGVYVVNLIFSKKVLNGKDFYGQYVIDRDFFAGPQADWQYNTFRFEIKENDSIFFYVAEGQKVNEMYSGKITTLPYKSARLKIKMNKPVHHVMTGNPTIYRGTWDFFMVFNSPKFNNMYFRKGEWQPIE